VEFAFRCGGPECLGKFEKKLKKKTSSKGTFMPFQKKVPFKEYKRFDKKTQDAPFLVDFSPPGRQNAYFFQRRSPHTDSMFPPKKVKKKKKEKKPLNARMRSCSWSGISLSCTSRSSPEDSRCSKK
jgi:hypothetical protein